jgi:hypothetical protein
MQLRLESRIPILSLIPTQLNVQPVAWCLAGILLAWGPRSVISQTAPGYVWTVASGTTDAALAVAVDAQGQVRTAGHINPQLYLHSYDTNGQLLQSATCTNSGTSFLAAAIDSAGNVYAAGQFTKNAQFGTIKLTDTGVSAMFLAKYNPAGVALWAVGSTGGVGVTAWAVGLDSSGNAYVTGEFMGSSAFQVRLGTIALNNYSVGAMDAFIAKIDPSGKILWATRFGDGVVRRCLTVAVDKSGNAYAGANSILLDQRVYKFSSAGTPGWTRMSKAGGAVLASTSAAAIAVDGQGNVCVTGLMCGTNLFGTTKLWTTPGLPYGSDYDVEVTKYDGAGNVLWAFKDGYTNLDSSLGIVADAAGNAFVQGAVSTSTIIGGRVLTNKGNYLAKCNAAGGFVWALPTPHFPNQSDSPGGQMAVAADGSLYFAAVGTLSRLGLVDPPIITVQPTNQTVHQGDSAILRVEATPARAVSYLWYRGNSGDVSNPAWGTSNVFTTPAIWQTSSFWVRVSNPAGFADSATATITLPVAPKITSQPQNAIIVGGQSATLTVVASGTDPMGYQWERTVNAGPYVSIDGANSATYITGALTNTASFRVLITNAAGGLYSDTVAVTVVAALQITQQPQSLTISNGQRVTLSVAATGGQAILYQWFIGDSGDTNNPVPGAVFSLYTTPPLTSATRYWVMLRSAGSSVASQTALLSLAVSRSTLGALSLAGGKLNLRITGAPGSRWAIQTSSDLMNWVSEATLGTVTLDGTGAANLQAQPDLSKSTFYRATILSE